MEYISLFILINCAESFAVMEEKDMLQLVQAIFPTDYNKYEPPSRKDRPAHVYLGLNVMDVDNIDDGAMEFSIQSYVVEFWMDHRLNLSMFHSEMNLVFPTYLTKYLWVPDLVFDNTKRGMLFHLSLPNTFIRILEDGTLYRSSRYNLIVGCQMDFRYYPMDTQQCFIKIATLSNPDNKVLLHWSEENPSSKVRSILLMNDIQPLKYMLRKPEPYKSTEVWTSGNYTYLYANFTFVRRLSGSLFNVYVPSTLVVLLSWISFWLDVEAVPARVTLGVTSLLTLATQVVQAHAGLPAISYMTAIDVWLFACLITVFSSLIEFAFSYQIFVTSTQLPAADEQLRDEGNETSKEVRILRPRTRSHKIYRGFTGAARNSAESKKFPDDIKHPKKLDSIARKVFPLSFIVFNLIYWLYYLLIS